MVSSSFPSLLFVLSGLLFIWPIRTESFELPRQSQNQCTSSKCLAPTTLSLSKSTDPQLVAGQIDLLYDSECPICQMEVDFLKKRDINNRIRYTDLSSPSYNPAEHGNVKFEDGMRKIRAVLPDNTIVTGVEVFRQTYEVIGLGWVFALTSLPIIGKIADWIYDLWAENRLRITGRGDMADMLRKRAEELRIKGPLDIDAAECEKCGGTVDLSQIEAAEVDDGKPSYVVEVTSGNLDELVIDSEKDVMIEFWAPWCSTCKVLKPQYKLLAEAFKDDETVLIAAMDVNSHKPPFQIKWYPTIFYIPALTKIPETYEGVEDFPALKEFLLNRHELQVAVGLIDKEVIK